ncbi:MAG: TetR/AcrR family transcriptional regulator [Bacillota bacterium]|nr:TetR/AcrR family transcriptional regulator [Bacillota bacterium]
MDLREIKTKRAIKNAFIQLRARKPLEKIKVKELCDLAEISKATFYLHYQDIYHLSEVLEEELILSFIQETEGINVLDNFNECTIQIARAFYSQQEMIDILFSKGRESILPMRLEKGIRDYVFEKHPELKDDISFNIWLTNNIMGTYFVFREYYETCGLEMLVKTLNSFNRPYFSKKEA